MSTRTIRTCAPLTLVLLGLVTTTASANHIRTLASANYVLIDDFGSNAHRDGCGNRAALSGGFDNKFDRRRSRLFIFGFNPIGSSVPFGPSWRMTVANRGPAPGSDGKRGGKQITYAYCVKRPPPLQVVDKSVRIGPGATASATATCPRGTEALSGGFSDAYAGTNGSLVFSFRSMRVGTRGWRASAVNMSATIGSELTAMATCSPAQPGLSERWRTLELRPGGARSTTLRCFPGTEPWSGGFESNVRAPSGHGAYPFRMKRTGSRGWRAAAFAVGPAKTFRVHVYCGPRS